MRKQKQQEIKQPVILIGIGLQIHDVRKIQNFIQEILEEEILAIFAESGFDDQPFIPAAKKAHHIARAIGVIDTLENHLILRNILCILYDLREYEYAFTFKLLQCFICNFYI